MEQPVRICKHPLGLHQFDDERIDLDRIGPIGQEPLSQTNRRLRISGRIRDHQPKQRGTDRVRVGTGEPLGIQQRDRLDACGLVPAIERQNPIGLGEQLLGRALCSQLLDMIDRPAGKFAILPGSGVVQNLTADKQLARHRR